MSENKLYKFRITKSTGEIIEDGFESRVLCIKHLQYAKLNDKTLKCEYLGNWEVEPKQCLRLEMTSVGYMLFGPYIELKMKAIFYFLWLCVFATFFHLILVQNHSQIF